MRLVCSRWARASASSSRSKARVVDATKPSEPVAQNDLKRTRRRTPAPVGSVAVTIGGSRRVLELAREGDQQLLLALRALVVARARLVHLADALVEEDLDLVAPAARHVEGVEDQRHLPAAPWIHLPLAEQVVVAAVAAEGDRPGALIGAEGAPNWLSADDGGSPVGRGTLSCSTVYDGRDRGRAPSGRCCSAVERDLAARPDGDVVQVVARQRRRRQSAQMGRRTTAWQRAIAASARASALSASTELREIASARLADAGCRGAEAGRRCGRRRRRLRCRRCSRRRSPPWRGSRPSSGRQPVGGAGGEVQRAVGLHGGARRRAVPDDDDVGDGPPDGARLRRRPPSGARATRSSS